MVIYFKTINTGDIPAGSYKEDSWTPDRDITLRKLVLVERSDKSLSNVQFYLTIADEHYTKEYAPAAVIGQNLQYCWAPDLLVKQGSKIYFKIVNSRADTVNVDVVFLYE
jgi:hypothetical protein